MLKAIAIVLGVIVIGVLGLVAYAATKPDEFRISRSTVIKAPPEKIAQSIQDFRAWEAWSPFEKLDPDLKREFSGAATGKGAVYAWDGNSSAGAGRMEILEADPSKVLIKLDFSRPFEAHNMAEFTLAPEGEDTRVTWSMYGPSPFVTKVMDVIFNIDKSVGKEFETGLTNLKTLAEKQP